MDIDTLFEKPKNPSDYSTIKISIASPEKIRSWSNGEIKKPENYKLQDVQTREKRSFLCQNIRARERLRMHLRKIQKT